MPSVMSSVTCSFSPLGSTTRPAAISLRMRDIWFCDTLKFTHIGSIAAT